MTRRLLALLALSMLALALGVQAREVPKLKKPARGPAEGSTVEGDPRVLIEDAATQQERLKRQFDDFKQALLRLAQRLEASSRQEDKDKARVLKDAIKQASEQGIDAKFTTLVSVLRNKTAFNNLDQLQEVMAKNEDLRKDLKRLIEMLLRDDRDAQLRREREEMSRLLEQLKHLIAKQERVRTQTEMGRKNSEELKRDQDRVTKETRDLAEGKKGGKGKEGKDSKGKGKDGKGKEGKDQKGKDQKGKDNKDGKDQKGKDSKDQKGKDSKSGQSGKQGQPGQQGDPKPQDQQNQQNQQEPNPVKKQIQDANKYQEKAGEDLNKKKNDDAVAQQDKALKELNDAKKKLEDLLRQLREEEVERLLAQLQARCQHMLALQVAVRDATVRLDKTIKANPKSEATRADVQASNEQSDKEEEIILEAHAAIRLIEAEGSAVAFAEVFKQVRSDMVTVAGRLRKTEVGSVTQTIENDIIETLKEMIEALKKARSDNKNKPSKPSQSKSGMPQDQKLIDMIAELKMIRSMQVRVNARTTVYGKQYQGEQVPAPDSIGDAKERERYERVQRELRELSVRQEKIGRITNDIATGKNENR